MTTLSQIAAQREHLIQQLSAIRSASMSASRNDDFRAVARLTMEAARVNRSIEETDLKAELTR